MSTITTLLPSAATAAVSAWLSVDAGATVKIGLIFATTDAAVGACVSLEQKNPDGTGSPLSGTTLSLMNSALMLNGPCTFRAVRPAGKAVGVSLES